MKQSNETRIKLFDLGLIGYRAAWEFQKRVFQGVKEGDIFSALIFCRHYPVITLGRSSSKKNIIAGSEVLKDRGIEVIEVERGGDVTYHGPGQLTAYPVINLNYFKKDLHWFLRALEEAVIDSLSQIGISCGRRFGLTGVWVGEKKVASIGICVRNWITFHGLSLNVKEDDLNNFGLIRPCGMDVKMTCLESILGKEIGFNEVKTKLIQNLTEVVRDDKGSLAGIR